MSLYDHKDKECLRGIVTSPFDASTRTFQMIVGNDTGTVYLPEDFISNQATITAYIRNCLTRCHHVIVFIDEKDEEKRLIQCAALAQPISAEDPLVRKYSRKYTRTEIRDGLPVSTVFYEIE